MLLCGSEEAARLLTLVGAEVEHLLPSGTGIEPGEVFLSAKGSAACLHQVWRVALSLLEYAAGVATYTQSLRQKAQAMHPQILLLTTRKVIPGTKPLTIKAILTGGAYPHRLSLSETVLIFEQHLQFLGGIEGLLQRLPQIQPQVKEKKILVEVKRVADALHLAKADIDGIQLDKLPVSELRNCVQQIRQINPQLLILATGGIAKHNITDYAATGVDGLVTTAPYYADPADIGVKLTPWEA
jgi:molybdenum transport protein